MLNEKIEQDAVKGICVSCDQETMIHEICLPCAIKLGIENQKSVIHNAALSEAIEKLKPKYSSQIISQTAVIEILEGLKIKA